MYQAWNLQTVPDPNCTLSVKAFNYHYTNKQKLSLAKTLESRIDRVYHCSLFRTRYPRK